MLFTTNILYLFIIFTSLPVMDGTKLARKQKPNVVLADNAFCENLSSAFYVSDNTNVVGTNVSAIVRNVTEARCLELCTNNHDAKGRLVFCASAAYETKSSTCFMYRKSSAPDGELAHRSESGKRFFEKFCLADDLPVDCGGKHFVRIDEYILKGYAQATVVVPTLAECVAHCVREKEFQCKSAMYFYEEGECITNIESAITQPDDFMKPDDDDKVIFFHNGCIQHIPTSASDGEHFKNQVVRAGGADIAASEDEPSNESKVDSSSISEDDASKTASTTTQYRPTLSATTTTNKRETTVTIGEPKIMESKSTKLNMKENIHPVFSQKIGTVSMPIAPSFSRAKNDESDATASMLSKNIQTRLYGARQLEKSADGTFSFHEKAESSSNNANTTDKSIILTIGKDGGPEHPPSGQIVVEDVINNGGNPPGSIAEENESKLGQIDAEKLKKQVASPPGVAPPQSKFFLAVQRHSESDTEVNHHPNLSAILTSTKSAPRATMPKVLIDQQNQQLMEQQKLHQIEFQTQRQNEQQKQHEIDKEEDLHKREHQNVQDDIKNKHETIMADKQQKNLTASITDDESTEKSLRKEQLENHGKIRGNAETNKNAYQSQNQKIQQMKANTTENKSNIGKQRNGSEDVKNKDIVAGTHAVDIAPVEEKPIEKPKVEPTKRLQLKSIKGIANDELEFFSAWGDWTPCHAAGERRIRRRKCLDLRRCRGALMQVDYCPRDLPLTRVNDDDFTPTDGSTPPTQSIASASSIANTPQQENLSENEHHTGPMGPLRSPLPINVDNLPGSAGAPPSILPQKLPEKELKPLPAGAPGRPNDVWSQWLGSCQQFASAQPCKNNQMIGFESRECIAKEPKACKGPFFRYCTLPC